MEIFRIGEMSIVRNSLGIDESIFNENNVKNGPLRSFLTCFLPLNCNWMLSSSAHQNLAFHILTSKKSLTDLPNTTHKFNIKAGVETHSPGMYSFALVMKSFFMLFSLLQSQNSFQFLQWNRSGFYRQEPPLLPTSDSCHQDVFPKILFEGLQLKNIFVIKHLIRA